MQIQFNKGKFEASIKGLQYMQAEMLNKLEETMTSSLLDVQTKAKSPGYVPVKTGTLKRSLTSRLLHSSKQLIGFVGTNLIYARIHEFGGKTGRNRSVNIPAKLYLTRAVQDNKQNIKRKFEKLLLIKRNQ